MCDFKSCLSKFSQEQAPTPRKPGKQGWIKDFGKEGLRHSERTLKYLGHERFVQYFCGKKRRHVPPTPLLSHFPHAVLMQKKSISSSPQIQTWPQAWTSPNLNLLHCYKMVGMGPALVMHTQITIMFCLSILQKKKQLKTRNLWGMPTTVDKAHKFVAGWYS